MSITGMCRQGLALGLALLSVTIARADFNYTAVGAFKTTAGSNTYSQGTATIAFEVPATSNPTLPTQISLGDFNTTGTTGTTALTPTAFFLTVFNLNTGHSVTFNGTLQGTLGGLSSDAFVQFSTPLSLVLDGVTVSIQSADNTTPGRLNIVPPAAGHITSIQGFAQAVPVPEPSTMALMGLGGSTLLGLAARRRLSKRAAV